jgi:hypothetical protein
VSFKEECFWEIRDEFQRLSRSPHWDRIVEGLWQRMQHEHRAWKEHGQWWRKTSAGRAYNRKLKRDETAKLKAQVVAITGCKVCGKAYARTAYDVRRHKRDRVCSRECGGRARENIQLVRIGRESMSLTRWAERYGLDVGTVWMRIKRGWTPERALRTPLANRGQKPYAKAGAA